MDSKHDKDFIPDLLSTLSAAWNTADLDFEDNCGLLSESESEDENGLKGMGVLSIIIIYN